MNILFCLYARLGDMICGIPAFTALRHQYPKAKLTWSTMKQHAPLVPKFGAVRVYGDLPFGSYPPWAKQPEYDVIIRAQPMWRHEEWTKSRKHILDLIDRKSVV